jgi:endonuclease/exonuclease/phosphatase family metal-dependent hydrolase
MTRLASIILACLPGASLTASELRVMTFNIWVGGESGRQPLSQTAAVIRAAKADIVGLQETRGSARDGRRNDAGAELAKLLGWHYQPQGGSPGILSRFPIVAHTPGRHGVVVRLADYRDIHFFNVHFNHAPYQPYQLLGIPYGDFPFIRTAEEAVRESRRARGGQVTNLLADMKDAFASGNPVVLTGDFNEPSHQDWTDRAAKTGMCPLPVAYPSTLALTNAGLRDAFRTAHPDEVARPGRTWTPLTRPDDPKDRHDRIDFIFFAGKAVTVKQCELVGEAGESADIVVTPYPSDHRAVVATLEIDSPAAP